jgi:folate-binding protein YgfZ
VLLAQEDRLWVEVAREQVEPLLAHLRKYLLADRVEIRPLDGVTPVAVLGPRAGEVLGVDLSSLDAPWSHTRASVLGTEVVLQRRELMGAPAWTVWSPEPLADRLVEAGGTRVGFDTLEVVRVEAGIPRFGQDFGPDNFPQETGIEEAVSYTKGCYLGQEIVARIHYRDGVQNLLRGLVFEDEPAPGSVILHEGRAAGKATTVVRSPALGKTVGLGILHRRAAEPGTQVEVEGGRVRGGPGTAAGVVHERAKTAGLGQAGAKLSGLRGRSRFVGPICAGIAR